MRVITYNTAGAVVSDVTTPDAPEVVSQSTRTTKIAGAKVRARQISVLAQTPAARTSTAWTQGQRVAILDAVGDLALMLSWLADDLLRVPEAPD